MLQIFSNFITIAFIKDSATNMVSTFKKHYWNDKCNAHPEIKADNVTSFLKSDDLVSMDCNPGKLTSVIFRK